MGLGLFIIVPLVDPSKSKKIIGILIGLSIIYLIGTLIRQMEFCFNINIHNWHWSLCGSNVSPSTTRIVPIEETGKHVGKVMSGSIVLGIMIACPLSIGRADWFGWRMVFLSSLITLSCRITVHHKIFAQL